MSTRVQPGSRQVPQGNTSQPSWTIPHREQEASKCKTAPLTVFSPESDSDSCWVSVLESEDTGGGWTGCSVYPAVTCPHSQHCEFLLRAHAWQFPSLWFTRLTLPSHGSGPSRHPSLEGREPTSHRSLGPCAELTASLGASDSRLCPHTGVSENVCLGI